MHRFAIIGCGTAGLATAILLARAGHKVAIFERFPGPSAVGAGILVQPSGAAVLRELGLLDAVERSAARIDALDGRRVGGQRIMDVFYPDHAPGTHALGVHRANLLDVLFKAAIQAGVDIECACDVQSARRETSGKIRLGFENGPVSETFDAAVIANGTQSRLRAQLDIPQTCRPYPWGALWAICSMEDDELSQALVQRYHGASVMIGVMPTGTSPETGKPCSSFFWSLKREELARWQAAPLDGWKADVLRHWPEIRPLLARITSRDQLAFATYADVRMRRWNQDNIVVIGDAAHGMSPQLGQGANLALLDAFCLARCVAEHSSLEAAFAAYSTLRRKHLRFYQHASRLLTSMFQSDSRVAAWLRDWGFPVTNRFAFTRREAVRTVAGLKTGWMFDQSVTQQLGLRESLLPEKEVFENA